MDISYSVKGRNWKTGKGKAMGEEGRCKDNG